MEAIIKITFTVCPPASLTCRQRTNFEDETLCKQIEEKTAIVTMMNNVIKIREPKGFSLTSPCHEWHKQLFSYFHCISFKFPFCVLEMNIWSFPPEPVTNGPLKLGDTALCLWHCGIYRRKRSNSSAEREHEKVNTVSWRFTCLEALFVSNVLTTNVLGQQSCTMFAFLEMIVLL